jgi:AcrR family transcriptional regulator
LTGGEQKVSIDPGGPLGIEDRRAREREQRRRDIMKAAWEVAEQMGWAGFSVERVAEKAELGRATVYGYFDSLETLVGAMADEAIEMLAAGLSAKTDLASALDAPLRFSQAHPAAFALLFQDIVDPRPALSKDHLAQPRADARQMVSALRRLAARSGATLPSDAAAADAFLAGISMAGIMVPELRDHTPMRRRWQDFCLEVARRPIANAAEPVTEAMPAAAGEPATPGARDPR